MDTDKINADDVFFHKYFNVIGQTKDFAAKKAEKKKRAEDGSEIEYDDEDEEEIWKALVDSRPEVEGDDADADMDFDDLDDLEMSDVASEAVSDAEMPVDKEDGGGDEPEGLDLDEDDAEMGSDEEVPSDLDAAFAAEVETATKKKGKAWRKEEPANKKRRLKNLPTFASADDYAKLLGDDEDED